MAYQIHHNFPDMVAPVPTRVRHPRSDAKYTAESVYAFYYFDIVRTVVGVGGERIEVASERRNVSKRYYIDARMLEYEEICNLPGDYRMVLHYMDCDDCEADEVLLCRTGNFVPYEPMNDVLLSSR